MTQMHDIQFIENQVVKNRRDHYLDIMVDTTKILKSWQSSLYSYEWMLPDGRIKDRDELPESQQHRRDEAEEKIKAKTPLEKPILGIGLTDSVEIGSGKALFLILAAAGIQSIPVHIPKSNKNEFTDFLS